MLEPDRIQSEVIKKITKDAEKVATFHKTVAKFNFVLIFLEITIVYIYIYIRMCMYIYIYILKIMLTY